MNVAHYLQKINCNQRIPLIAVIFIILYSGVGTLCTAEKTRCEQICSTYYISLIWNAPGPPKMADNTLSFADNEISTVLAQVTSSSDFLQTPAVELQERDLERETKKLQNFELHSVTLAEYLKTKMIPRGLRIRTRPTFFKDNPEYCTKFEQILNKCSIDIMTLTLMYIHSAMTELKIKIRAIESQLLDLLSKDEYNSLQEKVATILLERRKEIEFNKKKKFLRDTEDYKSNRIYHWPDSTGFSPRRSGRASSMDSQRSASSQDSRHSDEQRRPKNTRRPPRTGTSQQQTSSITTRSQLPYDSIITHSTQLSPSSESLVINISSTPLSPSELTLLQRGLYFCPSYGLNSFELELDLLRFFRNIRLRAHFEDENREVHPTPEKEGSLISSRDLGLRTKSTYMPPRNQPAVETFIKLVQRDTDTFIKGVREGQYKYTNNLTNTERVSLDALKRAKKVILKPADKGGALVVMDKTQYVAEVHRQLNDTAVYKKLDHNPTSSIATLINNTLRHYHTKGTIDTQTVNFLTKAFPIIPVFYVLPKIHKDLHHPPGRPIVASTESILSPLSIFLEKILTPHVKHTTSFLLDTTSFLKVIRQLDPLPSNTFLVTWDVTSLYTSIKYEKGMDAVKTMLTNTDLHKDIISLCLDLLQLVLHHNFFMFQDTFYLQVQGTAMGSNVAPPYANCFMAHFETIYVYPSDLFITHCKLWKRYIDDIFCIWTGTAESLLTFHNHLNSIWPELQFTIHYNNSSIAYLDTVVTINSQGKLKTDLYRKDTDRNSLLHFSSFHPPMTKKSLPCSQLKRIQTIVDDPVTLTKRADEMKQRFRTRGYPEHTLKTNISNKNPRNNKKRIPFVHTFHPSTNKVLHIIRNHWPILKKAYPKIEEFHNPILSCNRRPRNLQDNLVRADLGSETRLPRQIFLQTQRKGTFPCLTCSQCSNVQKGSQFTHPQTDKTFHINGFFTCDTDFVVYLIKCPCRMAYVGETTQKARDRICQHKSTIRRKNLLLPVPAHFDKHKHSISQLKYQIIEQVPSPRRGGNRIKNLKLREAYWIHTLQTLHPKGMNKEYEIQCLL
ncbi:uncharacterized protein LOC122929581 [Bufo gargarizans]|uniref:uncharacterized protein LOC122929581 n=1 Tax=Bufo gargarizans TaxID=30331 RepID=UPI001CF2D3ED|nr:uncharacterized protein LOC122929581 [Bufo gargarizans]